MRPRATSRVDRTAMLLVFGGAALWAAPAHGRRSRRTSSSAIARAPTSRSPPIRARRPGRASRASFADKDRFGKPIPGTARRSARAGRTRTSTCCSSPPTTELYVKPDPVTTADTNKLWDWDVAEAFIGTDFEDIKKYKEFQVSPQGEWVDLAIDRGTTPPIARHHLELRLRGQGQRRSQQARLVRRHAHPAGVARRSARPKNGAGARMNLYRCQGPPADRKYINWQPVNNETFHTPEAFGKLRLDN